MNNYYFVVIEGARFKSGLFNRYSGLVDIHPLKYLENVIKKNEARKGYDRVFSNFVLLNWFEVDENVWNGNEEHRLQIYEVEEIKNEK